MAANHGGKGSDKRARQVSIEQYSDNWDLAYNKDKPEKPNETFSYWLFSEDLLKGTGFCIVGDNIIDYQLKRVIAKKITDGIYQVNVKALQWVLMANVEYNSELEEFNLYARDRHKFFHSLARFKGEQCRLQLSEIALYRCLYHLECYN